MEYAVVAIKRIFKDIIDCLLKGKRDTKMFKSNLLVKRNRKYWSSKDIDCLLKGKRNTKMFKNDLSRGTEITNRNGLLLLCFKRKLPEPFSREKIPKVRIWTKNLPTCSREFWSVPEDEMVHSGDAFPCSGSHSRPLYNWNTVATFCTVNWKLSVY